MKIGILGTGIVGCTIGTKLVALGHEVMMGSRTANNLSASEWVANTPGGNAHAGTFGDAARFGESILFNCTQGISSLDALKMAGGAALKGKILIDLANPLDFSQGMPPVLTVCNTDSLGEQIQRAFPDTKVVKTLNTINCEVMINPARIKGDHDLFVSGDDASAKKLVTAFLTENFGWKKVIDLGDITTARATEQILPLWVRLWVVVGHADFNVKVVY